jgi:tetratricopeptide (TPR) repeat protein
MMRTTAIGLALAVVAASCSSPQQAVEIRATAPASKSVGVSEAEAHLALGNVALALEGFRKGLREQPNDLRALVGIARSYDRMGRFDVSRKWFETALAAAPADSAILHEFAASLDKQGLPIEAASVRAEAIDRSRLASLSEPESSARISAQMPGFEAAPAMALALTPRLPDHVERQMETQRPSVQKAKPTASPGPRLERLSPGEVALVTRSEPIWNAELVNRSARSFTYRFVAAPPVARLLNAARRQGLAADTRARLLERGWKRIEIGDAPAVREKTLVLYPQSQQAAARRLASQFGFAHLRPFAGPDIIVLLGRDAARLQRS